MPMLEDLAAYLEAQGMGIRGTSLFIGMSPSSPDAIISLYEYQGEQPSYVHDQALPQYESPRVQVTTRDIEDTYTAPMVKARQIYQLLASIRNTTIGGTRFLSVTPLQTPFALNRDTGGRVLIACNYQVLKGI